MRERYPVKRAGDQLGYKHVNKLSDAARRFGSQVPGSWVAGHHSGLGVSNAGLPPFIQGEAVIISAVTDTGGQTVAGQYRIRLRYYDNGWKTQTDTNTWLLDATGSGATFEVGDEVTVYWHQQRGAYVPINAPSTATGGINILSVWQARSNNAIASDGGGPLAFGNSKNLDITADFVSSADVDENAGVSYDDATGELTFTKAGVYLIDVRVRLEVTGSVLLNGPVIATSNILQFDGGGGFAGYFFADNRITIGPNFKSDGTRANSINQAWHFPAQYIAAIGSKMRIRGMTQSLIVGDTGAVNSDVETGTFYTEILYIGSGT